MEANLKSDVRNPKSRGFTLLEVILSLALTSLVLAAVAMAIDIHLRMVDSNRTGVEEAQLARVLLNRIADDLRGTVLYAPPKVDDLVPDVSSAVGAAGGGAAGGGAAGGGASGEGAGAPAGGGGGAPGEESAESEDAGAGEMADLSESSEPQSTPGLFGNAFQIQMDTSRLPRIDELNAMVSAETSALESALSDVKTVSYYAISDLVGGTTVGSGLSQTGSGLVRREYDRASIVFAAEQGQLADLEQDVEPIAPEVAAIEFMYFDGTEMVDEWDSIERGGLPVAVEIAIGIIPASRRNDAQSSSPLTNTLPSLVESDELLIFRKLVHLPVAQPTTSGGDSMMSGESTEDLWDGFESGTGGGSTGGAAAMGGSSR